MTENPTQPVSGRALDFWLVGYALALLAQIERLPLWLTLVGFAGGAVGWLIRRRGWRPLSRRWLMPMTLGLVVLFWLAYRGQFTVDTAASFLVLTVALKWLELRQRRDLFVLFFIICYLVVVTLLFQKGLIWAVVLLGSIFLLFTGLQLAMAGQLRGLSMQAVRRSGGLFLKMAPVVVVLFVFFPRMGPLWSVPLVSEQGVTGLSEEMTPGDVSNLAQNSDRAFRVEFGGDWPRPGERYWRAIVLDVFDGRTWSRRDRGERERASRVIEAAPADALADDEYEILMEPHYQRWGFALVDSVPRSPNARQDARGMVRFERSVDQSVRYRMGFESERVSRELGESGKRFYTHLPASGNEMTRAWVAEQRMAIEDDRQLVTRFMRLFNQEPFHYTLRPPRLGEDPVDELLFDTRRGFCEHYASALAFMLRAAGIPARIMTGYLGGESGLNDQYLIVRQYDAHAWVEAWLPEFGWFRLDPTAQIAPDRIELGLREAMRDEGSFLEDNWASPDRYQDLALVNWLRLRADAANYYWQRWVVGYEGQTQLALLSRLPGNIGLRELGFITAGLVAAFIALAVIIGLLRQHQQRFRDPWHRLYDRWCRWLVRQDLGVGRGDSLSHQVAAVARAMPEQASEARAFKTIMTRHFYADGGDGVEAEDLKRVRRLFGQIRRSRLRSKPKSGERQQHGRR